MKIIKCDCCNNECKDMETYKVPRIVTKYVTINNVKIRPYYTPEPTDVNLCEDCKVKMACILEKLQYINTISHMQDETNIISWSLPELNSVNE